MPCKTCNPMQVPANLLLQIVFFVGVFISNKHSTVTNIESLDPSEKKKEIQITALCKESIVHVILLSADSLPASISQCLLASLFVLSLMYMAVFVYMCVPC